MANTQTAVPLFVANAVLTAAQQNISAGTGVPVFATTVTRDAAFGGSNKALAEGQLCYLESTDVVQQYNGSSWITVGPASASALTFITGASFTASSTVSMASGVFTSTYSNYLVILNITSSAGDAQQLMRVNNAGTPRANDYYGGSLRAGSASASAVTGSSNAGSWNLLALANTGAFYGAVTFTVYEPANASVKTRVSGHGFGANDSNQASGILFGGVYNTAEANDGLTFIFAASSTGFYRVYGLADA